MPATQEVERGRWSLDAPIGRYLPTFAGDRTITLPTDSRESWSGQTWSEGRSFLLAWTARRPR